MNSPFSDADLIVKARLERSEVQMLDKLVEGLGHLGIVTTTNSALGEVKKAIENMPFEIEFI
jgi:hypothetical protein